MYHQWTFCVEEESSGESPPPPAYNEHPTADAGGPYSGYVNSTITFDGSDSSDSDGSITGYKWDFENDNDYDTDWLTNATTTHSYSSAGNYTVKLKVKDDESDTDTDTATVTITEIPPVDNPPTISDIERSIRKVTSNDNITISANVTDDYGLFSVLLNWNDGSDHNKSMTNVVSIYSASIGPFSKGTNVQVFSSILISLNI